MWQKIRSNPQNCLKKSRKNCSLSKFASMSFCFISNIILLWIFFLPDQVALANLTKVSVYGPTSIAVSGDLMIIGELNGVVRIFDMEKGVIVARVQIRDSNVRVFNSNGHIFAVAGRILFEITSEGKVAEIGVIPGRFMGFDNDHFYYISEGYKNGTYYYP